MIMNDSKTMGSVAEKLLCLVSTSVIHDFNYEIAVSLLKNYGILKNMSIGEIADLCYVSKASISRFCRYLGFEDFKEFHRYLQEDYTMRSDYSRQFYHTLSCDQDTALSTYRDELIGNIYSTVTPENLKTISSAVSELHDSERVAFFSHHFLWDIGRHFQGKMMMMGRYIELFFHYNDQYKSAASLQPVDVVIVCSVGGSYPSLYPAIWKSIVDSGCKIFVITQNMSSPFWNQANFVLRCGTSNKDDIGKYSALMAVDLIIMEYMKKYDKKSFL